MRNVSSKNLLQSLKELLDGQLTTMLHNLDKVDQSLPHIASDKHCCSGRKVSGDPEDAVDKAETEGLALVEEVCKDLSGTSVFRDIL